MISIYRAKKIDSDEWVEGYLYDEYIICVADIGKPHYIDDSLNMCIDLSYYHEIDQGTLEIHFPSTNKWYSADEISEIIKGVENV